MKIEKRTREKRRERKTTQKKREFETMKRIQSEMEIAFLN